MSIINVILAPTLEAAKGVVADVSVEAEYGSTVCEGRVLTLAHHQVDGPYSFAGGARAPCNASMLIAEHSAELKAQLSRAGSVSFLVSHLDLDTVGGIARVLAELTGLSGDSGLFTNHEGFWRLAEYVDLSGPHRALKSKDADDVNMLALNAYWAHQHTRAIKRTTEALDVTNEVESAIMALNAILVAKDQVALTQGRRHAEEQERLDANSLIECCADGVVVRAAPTFVNHLYGTDGRAVVSYNQSFGSITMSLADPVPGVSCRALVQELFGPDAGGHDGIAGSPRGKRMTFEDFTAAVENMRMALDVGR